MVKIIHYERANKNKTIGYVDVMVPIIKPTVIFVRKIAHVQSGDKRWFNLSSFQREYGDAPPSYHKHFEFETQVHNTMLLESLSEKVREYCAKNGMEEVETMDFNTFPSIDENDLPF